MFLFLFWVSLFSPIHEQAQRCRLSLAAIKFFIKTVFSFLVTVLDHALRHIELYYTVALFYIVTVIYDLI